ncbi:membrane protein [Actinomycetospora sp. NBRC 106375]|uniref:Rv1733c family protein n=1 Tax=Actinomycetospora sp. NBRC 106375 TaxID=3032207 RepID=UPI0024A26A5D|nr:hypothetical protein [Actinomycetospora sp. NBRC 106375]GLZ49657.1 membrane protein [Actinomycetospora sp. NBRC 106375]
MRDTTEATRRVIGAFVPRPSTLRRRSDRIEVGARWVLLVLGLMLLPVFLTIGSSVTARLTPQIATQQAERHQVTAVVLAPPENDTGARPNAESYGFRAPVGWTAADGTRRVVVTHVPSDTRRGDTRTLWVDRADRPTVAPMTPAYPAGQGILTTLFLVVLDLVVSLQLLAALRWVLDRARLRAWERAWRRFTGPDHESRR